MARMSRPLPASATGWARLRTVLDRDGSLSAVEKALIVALVAADRGRAALLDDEAVRLRGLGGEELLDGGVALLALSRGRAVADRFAAAAGRELDWSTGSTGTPGPDESAPAPADPDRAEVEAARDFFAPGDGPAPAPIALLAAHAPGYLVGYRALREGLYAESGISARLAELALFAVSAGDYVEPHAAVHAGKALAAGADGAQLVEAGLCAVPAAGMAAWLIAAGAIASVAPEAAGE